MNIRKEKGITLIALVITIIVMIIISVAVIFTVFPYEKLSNSAKLYTKEEERSILKMVYEKELFDKTGRIDLDDLKSKFEATDEIVEYVTYGEQPNSLIITTKKDNIFKYINGNILDSNASEEFIPVAEGNITFGSPVWEDGTATVTLSTNLNYTIEYQVNSTTGTWTPGDVVQGLKHEDIVYARLSNKVTGGDEAPYLILDATPPTSPTIEVVGGILNSGYSYYNGAVTIKVTGGEDLQSGVDRIEYTISGASKVEETEIESGVTFQVTGHGTHTITAYTYDKADLRTEATNSVTVCINHDNETTTTTEATCTGTGVTSIVCKKCGNSSTGSLTELGHLIPETYTTDETNHWKVCGRTGCSQILEETAHTGGTATCTAAAVCTTCGSSYGSKDASNHTGTKSDGECTSYTWSCCKATGGSSNHSYTSTVTKSATCTAAGNRKYTCKNCGYSYNSSIKATGHSGGSATCKAAAVCTTCGSSYGSKASHQYTGSYKCSSCNAYSGRCRWCSKKGCGC